MTSKGLLDRHRSSIALLFKSMDAFILSTTLHAMLKFRGLTWDRKYVLLLLVVFFTYYVCGHFNFIYRSWRGKQLRSQIRPLILTWLETSCAIFALGYAFKVSEGYSRLAVFSWLLLAFCFLLTFRACLHLGFRMLRSQGRNIRTVGVMGSGTASRCIARVIFENPWMGLRFGGFYGQAFPPAPADCSPAEWKLAGTLDDLVRKAQQGVIDQVFLCSATITSDDLKNITARLADTTAAIYVVPDTLTFSILHGDWADFAGVPAIRLFDSPFFGINNLTKRVEDLLLSLAILIVIALPMCCIAVLIKLTSKGPVLFKQRRYGVHGEEIIVWKFRSMTVCEDGRCIHQACKHDPRVTPLGAFLRRTSLDEFPQFFNVLQGRMSIVGPRPHAVAHNEYYRKKIFGYMLRHKVKPGITGWAQVNGWRGETDTVAKMEKRIEYDLWYIQNWSLWLDIKIIFMTIIKGFCGKNAF